jgi:hypothetical protein
MWNPVGGWCRDFRTDFTWYWSESPQKRKILLNEFYFYRSNGTKYAVRMETTSGSNTKLVLEHHGHPCHQYVLVQNKPNVCSWGNEFVFAYDHQSIIKSRANIYCIHCYILLNGIWFLLTTAKTITHIEPTYHANCTSMLRRRQTSCLCTVLLPPFS